TNSIVPDNYTFTLTGDDNMTVYINGFPVATDNTSIVGTGVFSLQPGLPLSQPILIDCMQHLDTAQLRLQWSGPGITGTQDVPISALVPAYGYATRSTTDDSNSNPAIVTHTRYDDATNNIDPAYGLVTESIISPASNP